MKIALVSPYDYAYPGGVNNHISHIERSFTRMGHDVKIIAPSSKPDETRMNGNIIVFGRPVPIRASGSVVRSPVWPGLVFSDRVGQMLKQEGFDVVLIHEPLMPTLATAVLHHSSQELVVGTFHAYRHRSWGYPFWKPIILNRWFNKLDGRIAVSNAAKQFVSKYFPGDYTIIPNGIDVEHFGGDAEPIPEFSDDKLNILFVGRMEKRKGFKYLLGAYEIVKREFPQCRLLVVGPRNRSCRKYEGIVARRNIEDVVFAGYVGYDDLPRYYKSADIFCSPAIDKESFGLVLLEAMAAGKPAIASDITGYDDVVKHGVDGLLVKPADKEALADGILQLLNDAPLREKMSKAGRNKVGDYSWDKVSTRVISYYQDLLKGRYGALSE